MKIYVLVLEAGGWEAVSFRLEESLDMNKDLKL